MSNNGFTINNGVPYLSGSQPITTSDLSNNYIVNNPDAESGLGNWITYQNTAQNIPVTGTGGSVTGLTLTRSTSSPLHGSASFLLTQSNSTNVQGEGTSYALTIDSSDQARMLQVSFDYNASATFVAADGITAPKTDGTTSTNTGNSDIEVFIYDVTNAALIPLVPFVITGNGSNNFSYKGYFQTASNSLSYRLILHCATANANATGYTLKFDNVFVGTQLVNQGVPVTDWTAYTPIFTGQTFTSTSFFYKRIGDTVMVQGTGTGISGTSGNNTISLPAGLSIDTTKIGANAQSPLIGAGVTLTGGSQQIYGQNNAVAVFTDTALSTTAIFYAYSTASAGLTPSGPGGNGGVTIYFQVPVVGWSSNLQISNDADTRVVAAQYNNNGGQSITANTTDITFSSAAYDTHGAWNGTQFTAPVSGFYRLSGLWRSTANVGADTFLYVNGSQKYRLFSDFSSATNHMFAGSVHLTAGDTASIRSATGATLDNSSGAVNHHVEIERITGPATIAVSESVNAYYTNTAGTTITNSTATIPFANKIYDTHGAFNGSTGVYTIPVSGKYEATCNLRISSVNLATNQAFEMYFLVTSTPEGLSGVSSILLQSFGNGVAHGFTGLIVASHWFNAGDTIACQADCSVSGSLTTSNYQNFFQIKRIGN